MKGTAAAFALGGCSEPKGLPQDSASSPPRRFSTDLVFSCSATNEDAGRFGPVMFESDLEFRTVRFRSPSSWRTPVEILRTPPQDAPERNLKWVTTTGQTLTGRIGWQDDATSNPNSFGLFLGTRGNQVLWAIWTCKETSGQDR